MRLIEWLEDNAYADEVIPGALWRDGNRIWEVTDAARLAAYIESEAATAAKEE